MAQLFRFSHFNEDENADIEKLKKDSQDELLTDEEGAVLFSFLGSGEYILKVYDEKQAVKLTLPDGRFIWMTYNGISINKSQIIALEPTPSEGDALYMWLTRIVSVVEWSNSSCVWKWHKFEAEDLSTNTDGKSLDSTVYTINIEQGIFSLVIGNDLNSFTLTMPPDNNEIKMTYIDFLCAENYFKALDPDSSIYRWIDLLMTSARLRIIDNNPTKYFDDNLGSIQLNGSVYNFLFDSESDSGKIYLPARVIDFRTSCIYEDFPDLPVIEGGELYLKLLEEVSKRNIELPHAPYEMGFLIKPKV